MTEACSGRACPNNDQNRPSTMLKQEFVVVDEDGNHRIFEDAPI